MTEQASETKDWQSADVLRTPMEVCWQFDYEIEIDKLRNLYSKSKKLQWDAEQHIDWDLEIDPSKPLLDESQFGYSQAPFIQKLSKQQREDFTAHVSAHRLSQFLHGEQGALMTAAALTHAVPDYEGKLYAATQTMDEARHVEVFEGYVRKLAIVYPISPFLKDLIDATLTADHWVKIAIGMNMVVEGLALGSFHNMRKATSCDLMRQIVDNVLRDEARHVAFGNVYVGETISKMRPDEQEDVAQFAFETIKSMAGPPGGGGPMGRDQGFHQAIENAGIDPADFAKGMMEAREAGVKMEQPPGTVYAFKDLMMPALVRVGAVTDRTRELFKEAQIPIFEDATVLESMEDADTGTVGEVAEA